MIGMRQLGSNGNDDTFLRLVVAFIGYRQTLTGLYAAGHRHQAAASIDFNRMRFLVERTSTLGVAINK